jgi:biotin-(acetyl-CoA carboxylase) ligase
MNFDEQSLARCLSGKRIGFPVYFFREVDSTNDVALGLASSGAAEGTAVIAGKYIKVRFNEVVQAGNVIGIDAHGALLLRDESNHVRRIMAGDASIIRG